LKDFLPYPTESQRLLALKGDLSIFQANQPDRGTRTAPRGGGHPGVWLKDLKD
jgi:hypothetical protein